MAAAGTVVDEAAAVAPRLQAARLVVVLTDVVAGGAAVEAHDLTVERCGADGREMGGRAPGLNRGVKNQVPATGRAGIAALTTVLPIAVDRKGLFDDHQLDREVAVVVARLAVHVQLQRAALRHAGVDEAVTDPAGAVLP